MQNDLSLQSVTFVVTNPRSNSWSHFYRAACNADAV